MLTHPPSLVLFLVSCNCRQRKKKGCSYNDVCRHKLVMYKVECKNTKKICIGCTQQHFKTRMQKHFGEVQTLSKTGQRFDSYARHFAEVFSNFKNISPDLQRNSINCSILWQGNPISAVKTFATPICTLCAKERLEILKQSKKNPGSLINSCDEIYGACRHNPKFHGYVKADPSAHWWVSRRWKGPYRNSYHRVWPVQALPKRCLACCSSSRSRPGCGISLFIQNEQRWSKK